MNYYYLNGKILPENKATISLTNLGLLRGYGVFDFLRTYNGKAFLFDEHLERFKNSAKIVNLEIPIAENEIKKIVKKLLIKNNFKESNIRIILTGGPEGKNMNLLSPTIYILISELKELPNSFYNKGVKLITYSHQRELPKAKTTNYLTAFMLKKWQKQKNAFEILYIFGGNVLEATTSNFFIIKNNKLITPKRNILMGTTRNLIIKISEKCFDIEERDIKIKELKEASEAFISATNKEIIPVVNIDGNDIGNGKVGNNTKKLIKYFKNYIANTNW